MSNASFACAVNCMDGRTQEPVIQYLKENLHVDYVDAVTEPGPIKFLAERNMAWVDNIRACCDVSVQKHGSSAIALIAHYDCAGNPQPKEVQLEQLRESARVVRGWYSDVAIYGLWVNENWNVEEVFISVPETK